MYIKKLIIILLYCIALLAFANTVKADGTPLVIVVHGVGDGNQPAGWSDKFAKEWKVGDLKEVTFRYPGRDDNTATSYVDFSRHGGDWALSVQNQIKEIVKENPNRPIVLVTHSWGTVATSIALSGGVAGGNTRQLESTDYNISPIDLAGVRINNWVTLATPLGRANNPKVPFNLRQLNVQVSEEKPFVVDTWTNIYDPDDPISAQSHKMTGADKNIEVKGSASSWKALNWFKNLITGGVSAHRGIWTNPKVNEYLQTTVKELDTSKPTTINDTTTSSTDTTTSSTETTASSAEATASSTETTASPTETTTSSTETTASSAETTASSAETTQLVGTDTPSTINKLINKSVAPTVPKKPLTPVNNAQPTAKPVNTQQKLTGPIDFSILVVDKRGTPIRNVNVNITGQVNANRHGERGIVSFQGFPEGTYQAKVQAKGYVTNIMPLTINSDMGGEVAGTTGVTILLENERGTPLQPLQAQTVTPDIDDSDFRGAWQGTARVTRDDQNPKRVGKISPLAIRFINNNGKTQVFVGKMRVDHLTDHRFVFQGNKLNVIWNKNPSTTIRVAALLTINQGIMTGNVSIIIINSKAKRTYPSTVAGVLNMRRVVP